MAQPLDYAKTVFKDVLLSFGFPRIGYPGSGTTYYYNFHLHFTGTDPATGSPTRCSRRRQAWIPSGPRRHRLRRTG